jgi:hypothetical protein
MENELQFSTNWTASIELSINHEKAKGLLIHSNILLDVRLENVKIDFYNNFQYLNLVLPIREHFSRTGITVLKIYNLGIPVDQRISEN